MLESTRKVDTVVLDKTGTVTTGKMSLIDVIAAPGTERAELLRLAGALENASEHPHRPSHRHRGHRGSPNPAHPLRTSRMSKARVCRASWTATPSSSAANHCSPTGPNT